MNMKDMDLLGFIGTFVVIAFIMWISGCAHPIMPAIDVSTWAGDAQSSSIVRFQDDQEMKCTSPRFDQMVCMTYDDLKKLYLTMHKCMDWGF